MPSSPFSSKMYVFVPFLSLFFADGHPPPSPGSACLFPFSPYSLLMAILSLLQWWVCACSLSLPILCS
ncbi:hypothetical protein M422DRAFT_260391 [Sphaerobolus stellatus SS14]|uniref:Uncharacterized protein n=1 Tax=Sphaerobolus stellatus (strain SS14) TaxID=990650 RepID=A0A0C9VIS1_SPHS4|nr:hypothetical protein M422DRAFT_260391 [Sphaerobolus stellatus SS14]